jgi:hypothetical protein
MWLMGSRPDGDRRRLWAGDSNDENAPSSESVIFTEAFARGSGVTILWGHSTNMSPRWG